LRPRRLHILIVDAAVNHHIVAEVCGVGPFTSVGLNIPNVAITNMAVAVDVSDQYTHARRGGDQGIAQIVVHIVRRYSHVLPIAGGAVVSHDQVVRVIRVNANAANRSTTGAGAVSAGHVAIESENDRISGETAAAFDPEVAGERQINVEVALGAVGFARCCARQREFATPVACVEFRARDRAVVVPACGEHLAVGQQGRRVIIACGFEAAGGRPGPARRILQFGAGER
jgi:hypothetical protein